MFDLTGKVAVVTGSTRGIGLGIVKAFQAAGASVVVSSEDTSDTTRVADDLGVMGIACDVTRQDDLERLVTGTVEPLGGIDILVCNAGIVGNRDVTPLDDFDDVMTVNLRSMVALTGLALPLMATRPGASLILMASLAAQRGNAAINAYALAKAGVAQLARNLAVQWGPKGVRTNAIAPGLIRTEFSGPLMADEAFMARRMQMTPLRRMGEVDDIAGAALFLASRAGAFVNGHNLVVDGGTAITDGS
jgi:NAD(P)-dependent dehydrogenase (short-subunit alcohol dehydrogenase family)